MKPSDAIICDVLEPKDWCEVESVVNHLIKSQSNGIRMDLEMKYSSKCNFNDAVDEEHLDKEKIFDILDNEFMIKKYNIFYII